MTRAAENSVWWSEFQSKVGVAGFLAVIASLVFTGWAAIAGARAARAAEAAIIVENRPWIQFVPEIVGDLRFEDFGANLRCRIKFRNVGNGPAKMLGLMSSEIDFGAAEPLTDFQAWIDKCNNHMKSVSEKETVFPNETYDADIFARISKAMIEKGKDKSGERQFHSPIICFGLFYKSAINDEIFYTARAYLVGRPTARGTFSAIPLDEGVILASTMALSPYTGLSRAS